MIDELFLVDNLFAAWFYSTCVTLGGVVKINAIGISLSMLSNSTLLYVEIDWPPMISINDFKFIGKILF